MKYTADNITDEQIRELLNLATLAPAAFEVHYPPPAGITHGSWRLAVVTDCTAALGLSNAVSMSDEMNAAFNAQARTRIAAILNGRANEDES